MQPPCQSFEAVLATHCAPVLFGKKPAALFPQRCLPDCCNWQQLRLRGFQMLRLYRGQQPPLIFVYHPRLLQAHLDQELTRHSLEAMGYPTHRDWRAMLAHLCRRFRLAEAFPHEVGFFLGYPPEDVLGFMTGAEDYKLCGPWKVYGDVDRAVTRFDEYNACRRLLLEHLGQGGSIFQGPLPALAG